MKAPRSKNDPATNDPLPSRYAEQLARRTVVLFLAHDALEIVRDPSVGESDREAAIQYLARCLGLPTNPEGAAAALLAACEAQEPPKCDISLLDNSPRWAGLRETAKGEHRAGELGPDSWRQRDGVEVPICEEFTPAPPPAGPTRDPTAPIVARWRAVVAQAGPAQRRLLKAWLEQPDTPLAEIARTLGMTPGAARIALYRLRHRAG